MSLQVSVTGPPGKGRCGASGELLLETGFNLLLEDGSSFIIENGFRTKIGYAVLGMAASGVAGVVSLAYGARVQISGVVAQGLTGAVLIWNQIVPGNNANWSAKPDQQNPGWQPIIPGQTPSWMDHVT